MQRSRSSANRTLHVALRVALAGFALTAAVATGTPGHASTRGCTASPKSCKREGLQDEVSLLQVTHAVHHAERKHRAPAVGLETVAASSNTVQVAQRGEEPPKKEDNVNAIFEKDTKNLRSKFIILDPHLAISICLLFAVSMMMGMVYLVHWNDWDMRFYSWLMISTTTSIFVAVLLFKAVNTLVLKTVLKDSSIGVHGVWALVQMLMYYLAMQFLTARSSGSFHFWTFWREPFDENAVLWEDNKTIPQSVKQQKFTMQRLTRSWSMMLAHATAFAALNCGGTLQHALWPGRYPALSFLVPIAMFALFVLIFRVIRSARLHCLNMAPCRGHLSRAEKWSQGKAQSTNAGPDEWAGGKTWAFETWDDETYDAEEDIAGVSVSFLLVQALRLNISGRLPDNFGVEDEHYMHGVAAIFGILLCGILFLVAHVAMVVTKYKTDEWSRLAKRCWVISQSALSMGFAWCLLYASQYTEARLLNNESPNTITERIILAFILSVVTLVLIFVLDKIADSGFQHKEVFYNIIMALSVLVGFSWEQCFDCAVENIGDRSKRPYVVNLALAFFLGLMVGIPWRRYVLSTVLWYEEERSKEAEASTD